MGDAPHCPNLWPDFLQAGGLWLFSSGTRGCEASGGTVQTFTLLNAPDFGCITTNATDQTRSLKVGHTVLFSGACCFGALGCSKARNVVHSCELILAKQTSVSVQSLIGFLRLGFKEGIRCHKNPVIRSRPCLVQGIEPLVSTKKSVLRLKTLWCCS